MWWQFQKLETLQILIPGDTRGSAYTVKGISQGKLTFPAVAGGFAQFKSVSIEVHVVGVPSL
jgi:hypothetical protein